MADKTKIEQPIIFSTEMVKAILDGRKTMTRRIIKLQPIRHCPYGQVGDRLWVRETWASLANNNICHRIDDEITYKASFPEWGEECEGWKRESSRFMPKKYARIWLEIINIRA